MRPLAARPPLAPPGAPSLTAPAALRAYLPQSNIRCLTTLVQVSSNPASIQRVLAPPRALILEAGPRDRDMQPRWLHALECGCLGSCSTPGGRGAQGGPPYNPPTVGVSEPALPVSPALPAGPGAEGYWCCAAVGIVDSSGAAHAPPDLDGHAADEHALPMAPMAPRYIYCPGLGPTRCHPPGPSSPSRCLLALASSPCHRRRQTHSHPRRSASSAHPPHRSPDPRHLAAHPAPDPPCAPAQHNTPVIKHANPSRPIPAPAHPTAAADHVRLLSCLASVRVRN